MCFGPRANWDLPFGGSTPLGALFREIHLALPEKGTLAKKHEAASPVGHEGLRSAEREVIFRTPQHQLGQGRHRPEGRNRPERNGSPSRASRCGRLRSDHPAEQRIAERLVFAPQAKVVASSVARDQNQVGCVGGEAAGEEGRGTFVVGIPSDRSVCIKQVLVEVEAVGDLHPQVSRRPSCSVAPASAHMVLCLVRRS